ncbi:MAG: methyltransferase domain-containing protein [Gemmatimonadota bacterium]|nr:MAG: methyltransferase domain-containing protein [Gemmatimonadota bacterium]
MSETARAPEWYREWFGEEYLALYPHRDEDEAQAGVALLMSVLGRPDGIVLDLACGAGRHMREFRRRGVQAVGLDLSIAQLRQARAGPEKLVVVEGDMRHLPFAAASFQVVTNFFTSFGYFAQPEEDLQVLAEIRRVLSRDGAFMLDFLNADRVRRALIPRDERNLGERRVVQERRLEEKGKVVVKEIRIYERGRDRPVGTYYERVRLYAPMELVEMLSAAGLKPDSTYGDYHGGEACSDCPRYILIGHAT